MAAQKYLYGIASVKYGTPTGSSTMPVTLTQWAQTVQGTFTLSEDESQTKSFFVEETTTPVHQVITEPGRMVLRWRAYDMTPALLALFKGGTASTDGSGAARMNTYAGPVSIEPVELALQIITTNGAIVNVYKASVLCRFDSTLGREQLLEVEVQATVLDPGTGGSPYMFKLPDPQA